MENSESGGNVPVVSEETLKPEAEEGERDDRWIILLLLLLLSSMSLFLFFDSVIGKPYGLVPPTCPELKVQNC